MTRVLMSAQTALTGIILISIIRQHGLITILHDGWWGHDTLPKLNYEGSQELMDYVLHVAKKMGNLRPIMWTVGDWMWRQT